jgi:crotonobetaine/carnitine-CoA ligase
MYADAHDPTRWVLPAVLAEQARTNGDKMFVAMVDGDQLTFRELHDQAAKVAGMLAMRGIEAGDRVALLLPNSLDFVRAWNGIGRLGAIAVPLNNELTGPFLEHPLRDSAPSLLIIHADYLSRLDDLRGLSEVDILVVSAEEPGDSAYRRFSDWPSAAPIDGAMPSPHDIACIMYTSGTTGAPKGVMMPHAHCYLFGLGVVDNAGIVDDDHYYICLPLFHANGLLMQLSATMIAGATATIRERFSASAWLDDIRTCGATVTNSLGAISAFVVGQPPQPSDRDHSLRLILSAPNHPDHEHAWRERFGIADVIGGYGMTEVNIPLYGERGSPRPGACGRPYRRYFEVEIRDPVTDIQRDVGEVGEIMVRPLTPGGFMAGYFGQPQKTVEAWRNLWFHTGDAGRMDADGYVYFVDRIKDCIRRRGENISAADIEASFIDLPGLAEVAAYAVPSEIAGGEDEIMLAIVALPGAIISPAAVAEHARRKMPRFAQPRWLEVAAKLPKTGTEKVIKTELRQAGVTPRAVDLASF